MRQLTKSGKDYSNNTKIVNVIEDLLKDLNGMEDEDTLNGREFRWATRWSKGKRDLIAGAYGQMDLIDFCADEYSNYGVTVFEHKGDLFVVPGFADDGWTHTSMNGTKYTVIDYTPVID